MTGNHKPHRRFYFLTTFALMSALLLWALFNGVLPRWFGIWERRGPGPERRAIGSVTSTVPLEPLDLFRFEDQASLARWEQKVFKGDTHYQIRQDEGGGPRFLCATSENSSCGLYMKVRREAVPELYLRWKWRAREFPVKKQPQRLSSRSEDDFAARLYVIFEASNLFRSDVIEYVWDRDIPAGTAEDSPYSERVKLLVVRSGEASPENGGWREELRNPLEDYMKLFGKAPRHPIGILALMSDSDNTGTRAAADFEEIVLGTKKQG